MNLTFLDNLFMKFPIDGNFDLISATKNLQIKNNLVLDVGFGEGGASLFFALEGYKVTALGWELESYHYPKELFNKLDIDVKEILFENYTTNNKRFGLIWASHVLEHTQNPGFFLDNCWNLLEDDGYLCIIVPPYKSQVVGGHITVGWNIGQLMYNLLVKGFDIKNGHFIKHGYNLCAFVKKSKKLDLNLRMDNGDIELTKDLWPIDVVQGFDGNIDRINWFANFKSYDSLEKKINMMENRNKTLEEKVIELENSKQEIEFKNKCLEELKKEMEHRNKQIESKNKYLEEEIKYKENRNKELEQKVNHLENRNQEMEKLIYIKNNSINDLIKRII